MPYYSPTHTANYGWWSDQDTTFDLFQGALEINNHFTTRLHLKNKLVTLTLPNHIACYVASSYWLSNLDPFLENTTRSLPTWQANKIQSPKILIEIEHIITVH